MAVEYHCCEPRFFAHVAVIVVLVLFAGLMSGLTLGLMSLSLVDLEVLIKSGTPRDRKHAAKILPVVKRQHLLLCTLLICNAVAMEALPIFLDSLVTAWGAILLSVTLILLFGEIIPQAVCSRYGLAVGAAVAPAVLVLVWICSPVAYPISKLLDFLLGKDHVALFRRSELKTLVTLHGNEAGKGGELTHDETTIIAGALELTNKTAKDAMTPLKQTFAIDINAKLYKDLMQKVLDKGHSRVPVYYEKPTNIIGLILVKNLLTIHPDDEVPVKNVTIQKIPRTWKKPNKWHLGRRAKGASRQYVSSVGVEQGTTLHSLMQHFNWEKYFNLQSSDLLSSLSKSKSSGRRTKSRWEPIPEEKLVEKPEPVTNDLGKVVSLSRPEATERAVNLFSSHWMIGSFMFFLSCYNIPHVLRIFRI